MAHRVLIVEDNNSLAAAMAQLLSRYGVAAETSGDGIDALKKFAGEPWDLVIMDLHLPGISGVEVIRKIRSTQAGASLPIIIVTGVYKGEEYARKAREAFRIRFYLEKPFTQEEFLGAVKESLQKPAAAPAPPPEPAPEVRVAPAQEPPRPGSTERLPAPPPAAAAEERPTGPRQVAEIKPRTAYRGSLREMPFHRILLDAKKKRATGILFVKKGEEDRTLLFVNGVPVGMNTENVESSFGNYLFCKGMISLMEYQVYEAQKENGGFSDEIFVKMGCLLPDQYFPEFSRFMEESMIKMCGWLEGDFTFQIWPTLPEGAPVPAVNLSHVIHQGYKGLTSPGLVEGIRKKARGRYLCLGPAYYDHQMHLEIDPAEALFLERIDGQHKLEDILPEEPGEAEALVKAFGSYLALGMVEIRDRAVEEEIEAPFPIRERSAEAAEVPGEEEGEAVGEEAAEEAPEAATEGFDDLMDDLEDTIGEIGEPAPQAAAPAEQAPAAEQEQKDRELLEFYNNAKGKNYYEMFNMKSGDFDFSKLKQEYFRLTKAFSPENFIMSSGEVLSKAEEALSWLATGYNTLSNVVSKEKYDEMLSSRIRASGVPGAKDHDKMQAEVAFQSGMAFLEMGDWDGAEKALGEAVSMAPNNADMIAHHAYSVYNKNRKSIAAHKRAQEMLAQALKIKPRCAPAYAYRGALLLEEDKVSLAEADFRKALSVNPRYRFALKGLKKLEMRKQEEKKKGLFGRFRK